MTCLQPSPVALIAGMTLLMPVWSPAQDAPRDRLQRMAQLVVAAYNGGDAEALCAEFSQAMKDAVPAEQQEDLFSQLQAELGRVVELGQPDRRGPNAAIYPLRFERGGVALQMSIALDEEGKIAGLFLRPATPPLPVPERNTTPLQLPFRGDWLVFWGGDDEASNAHHSARNQRFAFDFLGVNEAGQTHKGTGEANEDYFSYGKEILAPADGVVTEVIDGVRDNRPGSMNPYSALGNAVFIQHAENEVSVLAHLKPGTIQVKVGDRVTAGQILGLCGNSGNSSEPHLHYHLQNTPVIQDGTGIKCFFQRVRVRVGDTVEVRKDYSPPKETLSAGIDPFGHKVVGAPPDFVVDASDVLSQHAQAYELHRTQKKVRQ